MSVRLYALLTVISCILYILYVISFPREVLSHSYKTEFPEKGVDISIISIPWNVSDPSKALILWSTWSPANCVNTVWYTFMTELPIGWSTTTYFLNLFTPEHEIEKPSLSSSLVSHLNPNLWPHSIPRPNNGDGNAARSRDALIIRWHIDDLLTVSGTT